MRLAVGVLFTAFLAWPALAQDADLEQRMKQLEERLQRSEAQNEKLAGEVDALRAQNESLLSREIDEYLSSTSELEGNAAKGTETKAGAFVTLYGFLRLDLYYDTARMNNIVVPTVVLPETGSRNNEEFALDVNLTRVGFLFNFGTLGNLALTGKLETDFSNYPSGTSPSRPVPRIRLAYFQVEAEKWWLRAGQDWDVISPLYPNVNHETLMWNCGNTGDRRPMIEWFYKGTGKITAHVALGLTGAVSNADQDGDGERDGFDSGLPNVQGRVALNQNGWVAEKKIVVGFWAAVGRLQVTNAFNGENDFTMWVTGVDITIPITAQLLWRGEVWYGAALGDLRGNIGQSVNPVTGEEVEGPGGWGELVFRPNEQWECYVGGSLDDPDNGTVPAGGPTQNWSGWVGVRRHWSKTFRTTFDVLYWETEYEGGGLGNTIRFNIWTSIDF